MGGTSGVEALPEQYEITENASMSDGVDGGLTLEDEMGMDTPIKGREPAGAVAASSVDVSSARSCVRAGIESESLGATPFPEVSHTQVSVAASSMVARAFTFTSFLQTVPQRCAFHLTCL